MTTTVAITPASDLRLPPEAFYWGVLDTSSLPARAARRPDRLGYLFESVLPVHIERVHATFLPIGGDRVLACGMDEDRLRELAAPGVLTLGPSTLPGFLEEPIDAQSITLLTGEFEPSEIRRARGRVVKLCAAAVLVCSLLVLAGQVRRAASQNRLATAYADATASVYDRVLPPSTGRSPALPAAARLTAELRSLDRTRGDRPAESGPREVGPTLASLLASWPADLHVTTEALSVSDTAINITARLPDSAAAERFERELRAPEGWRLAQPDVRTERDGILFRARMEPNP